MYFHAECEWKPEGTRRPKGRWLDGWGKKCITNHPVTQEDTRNKKTRENFIVDEGKPLKTWQILILTNRSRLYLTTQLRQQRNRKHGSLTGRNHHLITTGSVVRKR